MLFPESAKQQEGASAHYRSDFRNNPSDVMPCTYSFIVKRAGFNGESYFNGSERSVKFRQQRAPGNLNR
jgi:hypothetical protein